MISTLVVAINFVVLSVPLDGLKVKFPFDSKPREPPLTSPSGVKTKALASF